MPEIIDTGLAPHILLCEYQEEAFRYFIAYFEDEKLRKNKQIHTLFQMATGGRVIIVTGAVFILKSRISGALNKYNLCIA